jgi:hypothetical protein
LRPSVVNGGFERVKVGEVLPVTFKVLPDCGRGECSVYWPEPSSVRAVCVFAHSASDFDNDTDSTSLMSPFPAAGRQETLPFKTIASAHQANELAQQMH